MTDQETTKIDLSVTMLIRNSQAMETDCSKTPETRDFYEDWSSRDHGVRFLRDFRSQESGYFSPLDGGISQYFDH